MFKFKYGVLLLYVFFPSVVHRVYDVPHDVTTCFATFNLVSLSHIEKPQKLKSLFLEKS